MRPLRESRAARRGAACTDARCGAHPRRRPLKAALSIQYRPHRVYQTIDVTRLVCGAYRDAETRLAHRNRWWANCAHQIAHFTQCVADVRTTLRFAKHYRHDVTIVLARRRMTDLAQS